MVSPVPTRVNPPRLAAVLLLAIPGACGSESKSDTDTVQTGGATTAGGATSSGGAGRGGSAAGGTSPSAAGASAGGTATSGGSTTTSGGGKEGTGGAATGGVAISAAGEGGSDATDSEGGTDSGGGTGGATGGGGASGGSAGEGEPSPGTYGKRAPLPAANSEMAVAELDGKIYLIGGYPSSPAETQSVVAVYDIASDTWGFAAELPVGLHHPVAVGHDGKVYSLGGQLETGETDRTLAYDPLLDEWEDLAPMPTARGGGAAAVIGDKIYVAGGRPPAGNAFEVYDVSDDEWTALPELPQTFPERNHLAAAAIGGKVYVAGGRYDGGGFTSPMTRSLDIYDPETNAWTQGAELPRERGGLNGIAANGCFFTWGGEGGDIGEPNNVFPDHDVYDPIRNSWTQLDDLPTPVHGVTGAAFVGGLIYIPGGGTRQGGGSGTTLFQVYRPDISCL